jgi:Ser/Thr protein kinase RdoA (MazF antagonist)
VLRNVIAKDGVLTIVDWAGAGVGPRIVSLAPLLMGALRPAGWDRTALTAIAAAYRSHVQLDASEIERLGSALLIRQIWLAAWNYWTRTVKGHPPSGTEWWMPLPNPILAPLSRAARATLLG